VATNEGIPIPMPIPMPILASVERPLGGGEEDCVVDGGDVEREDVELEDEIEPVFEGCDAVAVGAGCVPLSGQAFSATLAPI
jgi:hypothetical protein